MSEVRIAAEPRTEFGKGAARRVRRANRVPAVLYGHGTDPRHVSLPGHELMLALKHDKNVLLRLELDGGGTELALPRAVVKDPIKGHLEHVDLLVVKAGEKVTVEVPVTLTGDAASETLVDQQQGTVTVEAEATHIPESFEVSIEGLEPGASVTAADVDLPEGVTLAEDAEDVVVQGLAAPTAEEVEAELAEAEEELGAGAAFGDTSVTGDETEGVDADAGAGTGDVVPGSEETGGPSAAADGASDQS